MILINALIYDGKWWKEKDISAETFQEIFDDYVEFRLAVDDGGNIFEIRSANMAEVLAIDNLEGTVEEVLAAIAPGPLTTYQLSKLSEVNYVKQLPIWEYDVSVNIGNSAYGPGQNIPLAQQKDLLITSDLGAAQEGSVEYLYENCLVVANGLIYPTELVDDRLYVKYAARELVANDEAKLSIIDFAPIGGCDVHRVTQGDIRTKVIENGNGDNFRTECTIEYNGANLVNKTVLLVIAGRLHILDSKYAKVHQNFIKFNIDHAQAINHILDRTERERSRYIGNYIKSVGIAIDTFDAEAYLSAGDTMLVILNENGIAVAKERLFSTRLPAQYTFYRTPYGIAKLDDGKIFQYEMTDERDGAYLLSGQLNIRHNEFSDTVNPENLEIIASHDMEDNVDRYQGCEIIDIYRFPLD